MIIIPSLKFMYYSGSNRLCADIDDLPLKCLHPVDQGAYNKGLTIKSEVTGKESVWFIDRLEDTHWSGERWVLKCTDKYLATVAPDDVLHSMECQIYETEDTPLPKLD